MCHQLVVVAVVSRGLYFCETRIHALALMSCSVLLSSGRVDDSGFKQNTVSTSIRVDSSV